MRRLSLESSWYGHEVGQGIEMDVIITHAVVDMPEFPDHKGSEGSRVGRPRQGSVRFHRYILGHCQQMHHTGLEPDHPRVDTRWEEVGDERQQGTKLEAVGEVERRDWGEDCCQPGRLEQRHVPVLLQPCVDSLPPSSGPSILFGFL